MTAKDASLTDDLRREQSGEAGHVHSEDSLVYGEIDLAGFYDLLTTYDGLPSTGDFYDLGSGSGRAVFCARYLRDYRNCVGVELLPNLHQLAKSVQSLYKFQNYTNKLHPDYRQVSFVCSDLLDYDPVWDPPERINAKGSDLSVTIYIPNLLFDQALQDQIAAKALKLAPGTHVISLKQFQQADFSIQFELKHQQDVTMSWGDSRVYIYQKKR